MQLARTNYARLKSARAIRLLKMVRQRSAIIFGLAIARTIALSSFPASQVYGLQDDATEQVREPEQSTVGSWKLSADWKKGGGTVDSYFLILDSDDSGLIKDSENTWASQLNNLSLDSGNLSFSFFYGDKRDFEIEFEGTVSEESLDGEFEVFETKAEVVGVPLTKEELAELDARKSIYEIYQAREFTGSSGETLPYRLFVPENYDAETKYPLVLFHHGGGGTGTDNRNNLESACVHEWISPEFQESHPCFIVVPQIPGKDSEAKEIEWRDKDDGDGRDKENGDWRDKENGDWRDKDERGATGEKNDARETDDSLDSAIETMNTRIQTIHEILDSLEQEFSIDTDREYVTGLSFGGECTWLSLNERPDRFAAGVPVCGGNLLMGIPLQERAERIAQIPLWIFHGDADNVISVDASRDIVSALQEAGGEPKYTEYKGVGHYCWDLAYRDPELIEWLFAQTRATEK